MNTSTTQHIFDELFDAIERDITGEIEWSAAHNGTGYYNPLQISVRPDKGQVMKFTDPGTRRRGIIVGHGADLKSTIIFERYSPGSDSLFVVVANPNKQMKNFLLIRDGALTPSEILEYYKSGTIDPTDRNTCKKIFQEKILKAVNESLYYCSRYDDEGWVGEHYPEGMEEFKAAIMQREVRELYKHQ
jgi:hypothetical protein